MKFKAGDLISRQGYQGVIWLILEADSTNYYKVLTSQGITLNRIYIYENVWKLESRIERRG